MRTPIEAKVNLLVCDCSRLSSINEMCVQSLLAPANRGVAANLANTLG